MSWSMLSAIVALLVSILLLVAWLISIALDIRREVERIRERIKDLVFSVDHLSGRTQGLPPGLAAARQAILDFAAAISGGAK